jgi:hypothetical protein
MQCNLCFCESFETRTIKKIIYHQCCQCHLIYKDKVHLIDTNLELTRYLEHNNKISDTGYQNYFIETIESNIKPFIDFNGLNILDFGSGPNPVLQYVFKDKYDIEIKIYDKYFANDLDILNDKFDLITSIEVVEHIFEVAQLFNLFNQLLVEGGYLFIKTNFTITDFKSNYKIDEFSNWFYIRDITHVVFYSFKTFEYIANLFDYKIIHTNNKNAIFFKKELT